MTEEKTLKPILWVGSSKRDLIAMPANVITDFGYGLYQVQRGEYPDIGKTLSGFGGANVVELIQKDRAGSFRVVYTVKFSEAIVVLYAFQKKSKSGLRPQAGQAMSRKNKKHAVTVDNIFADLGLDQPSELLAR